MSCDVQLCPNRAERTRVRWRNSVDCQENGPGGRGKWASAYTVAQKFRSLMIARNCRETYGAMYELVRENSDGKRVRTICKRMSSSGSTKCRMWDMMSVGKIAVPVSLSATGVVQSMDLDDQARGSFPQNR